MDTVAQIEQALMDAGFLPSAVRGGLVYGGFTVAPLEGGGVRVTYTVGTAVSQLPQDQPRVMTERQMTRMERALSKLGHSVIMFEPEEGTGFQLTLR